MLQGAPAFPRSKPGWPLLAVLGAHLVLAWSWRIAHPPAQDGFEERLVNLIPVPPPAPPLASVRRKPEPPRSAAPSTRKAALPDTVRAPEPHTPAIEAPEPFAITAPATPDAAAASPLDAMVGRARRDAGAIDRELRKGKSGVPAEADTPWGRFTRTLEEAHIDRSRAVVSESYTSPDGETIYRFRKGGKFICRITGGVKPGVGNAIGGAPSAFDVQGGNGTAGLIGCPRNATWKRD